MKAQQTSRPGTARDREMGREDRPLGDLGERGKTWAPPEGTQGMSNRAGDEDPAARTGEPEGPEGNEVEPAHGEEDADTDLPSYVAGGDKSNRAAHSGATGERHPGGGANKPEPKNQDLKGLGSPRNNTDR